MPKKFNIKITNFIIILAVCIGAAGYYFYYTYPITINDVVNKGQIKKIEVSIYSYGHLSDVPLEALVLEKEQDLKGILDILGDYRYSKKLKFTIPRVTIPSGTYSLINIFIYYLNKDNELTCRYMYVDSRNNVVIASKNDVNIEYKISGRDKKLFERLSAWLKLKL